MREYEDRHVPFLTRPRAGLLPAALVIATAAFSTPASAQSVCADRAQVLDHLTRAYSERRIALGVAGAGGVIELLTRADGRTWTIILSRPDGSACVLATGEDWQRVSPEKRGEGT